jgi:hypothetical protein
VQGGEFAANCAIDEFAGSDARAVPVDSFPKLLLDSRNDTAAVGPRVQQCNGRIGDPPPVQISNDTRPRAVEQALRRNVAIIVIGDRGVGHVELDEIEQRHITRCIRRR